MTALFITPKKWDEQMFTASEGANKMGLSMQWNIIQQLTAMF
jgi:hypothetical protein